MWTATIGLAMLLAPLAWRYASANVRHRPVAALLTLNVTLAVIRRALAILNEPAYAAAHGTPLTGLARLNFHLDEALFLAWPCGFAIVSALVFLPDSARRWASVCGVVIWVLGGLTLALGYPAIRGPVLGRVYLAAELAAILSLLACGAAWWRRREMPSLVEGSMMVLGAIEITVIIGWGPFGKGWEWQAIAYLLGYAVLAFLHGGEVWALKSSRSS
jgi:hypothetical protein